MNDNPGIVLLYTFLGVFVIAAIAALLFNTDPTGVSSTAANVAPTVVLVATIIAAIYRLVL
jgi:hypothetical protein